MDDTNQAKAQIVLEDLKELDRLKQEFTNPYRKTRMIVHGFSAACLSGVALYLAPSIELANAFIAIYALCMTTSMMNSACTNHRIDTLIKILRLERAKYV